MDDQDRELIRKLRSGKDRDEAFRVLVNTYQKPLYYHIRRMVENHDDADDVLQETFLKVWRYIHSFKGESALYTWIYRIATNETLGFLRKRKAGFGLTLDAETKHAPTTDGLSGEEIADRLQHALKLLPEKQRQVFDLKYFAELKYEEIAEITGTSIGALKASYFHAVKKIENHLKA